MRINRLRSAFKARSRLSLFPPCSTNERLALMGIMNQKIVILPPFRSAALHQNVNPLPIHNSLRSVKQTAVWRLSPFSSGKSCELRDFAYGENLCVLMQDFLPRKSKDSSSQCPSHPHRGRITDREQAVSRLKVSADRPRHNIIRTGLWNKSRATL